MTVAFARLTVSLIFGAQMYLMMAVLGLLFAPLTVIDHRFAFHTVHIYCRWVRWTASWMIGLRSEIRGEVPMDEVLVASKHQSFFDIILLASVLPRPKFIMKKELSWAPIIGWYARRIGCIPVDRGKRSAAIEKMREDVSSRLAQPGQLIIYPQGTRVAPGAQLKYKVGTAILYRQLNHACVPAATNAGMFWPRRSLIRRPGLAVLEFLPRIPPGKTHGTFMTDLESVVEGNSDRLMAEAGFEK